MSYEVGDINIDDLEVNFRLYTKNCQTANLFRQILMSDIPTISIDSVDVYTNTSSDPDEYLAHRLGLIPLKCPRNIKNGKLELNVHATTSVYNVTAKDLYSNSDIVPVDGDLLICKLFPGQSLHIIAFVREGTGKEHAKWSPVTYITFKRRQNHYYFQMETLGTIDPKSLIQETLTLLSH